MKPSPEQGIRRTGDHMRAGHGGHGWLMMLCCIPMLAIAVALVAAGAVSPGFLFLAVMCTVMMAMMMRAIGGGSDGHA